MTALALDLAHTHDNDGSGMDGDVRCDAALNGDFDKATRYDAIRAWRFVQALIDIDNEAAHRVLMQIGTCIPCMTAFACALGGLLSGAMVGERPDGRAIAHQVAQIRLDELLDVPDLINPDPEPRSDT